MTKRVLADNSIKALEEIKALIEQGFEFKGFEKETGNQYAIFEISIRHKKTTQEYIDITAETIKNFIQDHIF